MSLLSPIKTPRSFYAKTEGCGTWEKKVENRKDDVSRIGVGGENQQTSSYKSPSRVMDKLILYPERYEVAVVETCRLATREERHCGLVFLSGWTSLELGNELRLCRESRSLEQQRSELLRQWWLGGRGERQGTMNEGPLAGVEEEAKRIPSLQPPSRHLSLLISHEITPSGRLAEHLFLLIWREMQLEEVK